MWGERCSAIRGFQGRTSFLKKRSKKLLLYVPTARLSFHRPRASPGEKSLLLLFFRKEGIP
jgi:hypothetical protein